MARVPQSSGGILSIDTAHAVETGNVTVMAVPQSSGGHLRHRPNNGAR
jgi:glycine/serine hydroxymethyltransferase